MDRGEYGYPVLVGVGLALLMLWSLFVLLGVASQSSSLGAFGQIPFYLGIIFVILGFSDRILRVDMQNPSEPVNRRNRLILLSSGSFILGFYLFVNGLLQLFIAGVHVLNYGWVVVDSGAYLIMVFGLAFGSMLLIAGVVAFKRFIDLSNYF